MSRRKGPFGVKVLVNPSIDHKCMPKWGLIQYPAIISVLVNKPANHFMLAEDNIFYIDRNGFIVIVKINIKIETKKFCSVGERENQNQLICR